MLCQARVMVRRGRVVHNTLGMLLKQVLPLQDRGGGWGKNFARSAGLVEILLSNCLLLSFSFFSVKF